MKKVFALYFVSIAAAVFFIPALRADAASFATDLQVGSFGIDVEALQTWLIDHGYTIPSIQNGASTKGTFGMQTKNAVRMFQKDHGITTTGNVGPLTRAALNAQQSSGAVAAQALSIATCPAGYICTSIVPTTVSTTPAATVPVAPPTSIQTPGVSGSLAVTLQSTPANGTALDKGQSADIARYKIQAGSSDMKVSSLQIDFNSRLWLYSSTITITDETGYVVAKKDALTGNDFTELTVGSDYRVTLPASYVIARGTTKYFTVNITMLAQTDRAAGSLSLTSLSIRSTDGTGANDTQTVSSARSFSFRAGTTGLIVITSDMNSPPNMTMPISTSATTNDVVLGIADFVSQGRNGKLTTMQVYMATNVDDGTDAPAQRLFRDIKIQAGDKTYSADAVGAIVNFTNMDIPLPADQVVPVSILATVNIDTNHALDGMAASSTLVASGTTGGTSNNPVVEDDSYQTIAVNSAPLATSDITFSASNSTVDQSMAKLSTPITRNGTTVAYTATFTYTLTAGDNTLYVSTDPNIALATSSTGFASNSAAQITDKITSPSNLAGDTASYYVIPAGVTRTFTWTGMLNNTGGTGGTKTLGITGVRYGTTSSALSANTVVYYNYAALQVSAGF